MSHENDKKHLVKETFDIDSYFGAPLSKFIKNITVKAEELSTYGEPEIVIEGDWDSHRVYLAYFREENENERKARLKQEEAERIAAAKNLKRKKEQWERLKKVAKEQGWETDE